VDTAHGQILLMPSEMRAYAGVKVVTIAPDNPYRGLPRINGVYILFDATTLVPLAQIDAPALTAVRTAAVSALAVDRLGLPNALRLVVFGAGPQAHAHVAAIASVRRLSHVTVVARSMESAGSVVRTAEGLGLAASAAVISKEGALYGQNPYGRAPSFQEIMGGADIVACCTTAREPLFDSAVLPAEATVVAVGSHEPDVRELDGDLMRRATVVVESRASAETAGDIVMADAPIAGDLSDLVAGRIAVEAGRPRVFKSVGEAWEDLAVAAAIYSRVSALRVSSVTQDR
jgi:ornithine cyclodeaminase